MRNMFIIFVLLPLSLLFSQSHSENPFPFTTIGPNLYKIEVDVNSIIASIGPDGVLLCDVGGESKGPRVMATVRKLGGEKIDYIIDTHWHVDHTGGNICFGKEALIIAHENVRKRLSEDKYLKFWDEEHPAFPEYALPDMVFSDRMTMHFNSEDIEITHLPGGHTDGDAIVYFRKSNILHIGDCLFSNGFPAIDFEMGGSVEGLADNLNQIASVMPSDVRIIVGHGPDYTIKELQAYETMVSSSLRTVQDAMQKDMSVEAMQKANLLEEWKEYGSGFFSCDEWINMIYQSLIYRYNLDTKTSKQWPELKGPYLGQTPPGKIPEIFAPCIISTGYSERIAAFTPDAKELFYVLWGAPHGVILHMKEKNGCWTKPEVAPFSGQYQGDFTMSSDGNTIVFSSNRPFSGTGKPQDNHYSWMVERTETGWGEARPFGLLINAKESFAGCPTIADNGNLYFFSDRTGGKGNDDIWMSEFVNGDYAAPKNLDDSINTVHFDLDPFVAPDESYIIFTRIDKERKGHADLYISFMRKNGGWTNAINMGDKINSKGWEFCPTVSPDGKYFFFTSSRRLHKPYSEIPLTYERKLEILNNPGNGSADIYWVDAKIIEELRPRELK